MTDLTPDQLPPENLEAIKNHNKQAWNLSVASQNRWTVPVSSEEISQARNGILNLILTPEKIVPSQWLGNLKGKKVLALASGGGQQGPILAAAGADVTVLDLSPKQLEQDQLVAEREGLDLTLIQGPADDLSMIEDSSIDLVFNPCSSCFFPELEPVWQQLARIIKPGGSFLTGFNNPIAFCFDFEKANLGQYHMKYSLPYSDLRSLDERERKRFLRRETPLEYSHTLTDQIGGLIKHGFVIDGFYEDDWGGSEPIDGFFPQFIALKARLV